MIENINKINKSSIKKLNIMINKGNKNTLSRINLLLDSINNNNKKISLKDLKKLNYKNFDINDVIENNDNINVIEKEITNIDKKIKASNKIKSFFKKKLIELKNKRKRKYLTTTSTILLYRIKDDNDNIKNKKILKLKDKNIILSQMRIMKVLTTDKIIKFENTRNYNNDNDFNELINILKDDETFKSYYDLVSSYIYLIIVKDCINNLNNDEIEFDDNFILNDKNYGIKKDEIKGIDNKFVKYKVNKNAISFNEIFKVSYIKEIHENYKENSCFFNELLNYWQKPIKEALDSKGKHKYKPLTYDLLYDILEIDKNINKDIGISIVESLKFFKKYNLGLRVYNQFNQKIFKYPDTKKSLNTNISPQVMRIIKHDNHVYIINHEIKKLDYKKNDNEFKLNDKFYINPFKENDKEKKKTIYLKNLFHLMELIKEYNYDNKKNDINLLECIYDNLDDLYYEIFENNYIASLSFKSGQIKKIKINNIGKVKICIIKSDFINDDDTSINIDNEETLKNYNNEFKNLYKKIINNDYMSDLNNDVLNIFEYYKLSSINGYFGNKYPEGNFVNLDIRKHYTDLLMKIKKIPKFFYLDNFVKYDGHNIEDNNIYIIKIISNDNLSIMLFDNIFNRCYGMLLNFLGNRIKYKIITFIKPSYIIETNFKKYIDELYNNKISLNENEDKSLKKMICNVITGLFEKKFNEKNKTLIFKNLEEAKYYKNKYDGIIYPLNHTKYKKNYGKILDYDLFDDTEKFYILNDYKKSNDKIIYIVNINEKIKLKENLNVIKEIIYSMSKIEISKIYIKMIENNIIPISIKVDSITFENKYIDNIKKLFDVDTDIIGGYRIEYNKNIINKQIIRKDNLLINTIVNKPNLIKINNEYDEHEYENVFDNNNYLSLMAKYPGSGKSYCLQNYKGCLNKLSITPYNRLCQEIKKNQTNQDIKIKSITINNLLGSYIGGEKHYINFKPFDVSLYDMIIFDEIFLYSPLQLKQIHQFMIKNKHLKYSCTGDGFQLESFNYDFNNDVDIKKYIDDAVNYIFKNKIYLMINKRLTKEEDRKKLENLFDDIFNNNLNIIELCNKYNFNKIYRLKDVKTLFNITNFNFRAKQVNKHIHNNIIKKPDNYIIYNNVEYWIGLNLICRKYNDINKNIKIFVNYIYQIIDINDKEFIILEPVDDIRIKLDIDFIDKFFSLPFSSTIFSIQGLTINEPITIFDYGNVYTNKNYLWTCITRVKKFEDINIFIHHETQNNFLLKSRINLFWKNKIYGYKIQDKKNNFDINTDDYINLEWINNTFNNINKNCIYCKEFLYITFDNNNKIVSNIVLDRKNNNLYHSINNINFICINCNRIKK